MGVDRRNGRGLPGVRPRPGVNALIAALEADTPFDDDEHWRATDPLARVLAGERFEPALFMSCGEHDPWGCLRGGEALSDAVTAQGGDVQWRVLPEGHCAIDTQGLAAFLAE